MKAKHNKCYLLLSGKYCVTMNVNGFEREKTECEKILGIKVDYELEFKNYLDVVIKKASNKINALPRVASFMSLAKR